MQDPIADMITRIRNAQAVYKKDVAIPASKLKASIAEVLKTEGYILDYKVEMVDGKKTLLITLKYYEGKPVIRSINRLSAPGLRVYSSKDNLPKIMDGMGIVIISTSKGVLSDRIAKSQGCGGELLISVC
jgi:small subunit ribosomal protein S8